MLYNKIKSKKSLNFIRSHGKLLSGGRILGRVRTKEPRTQCLVRMTYSKTQSTTKKYRDCVGVVLFNSKGQVLCGHRIDIPYWQLPQGGININESILEAAKREVKEELGIDARLLINVKHTHQPKMYFFTERPLMKDRIMYNGQKQKFILFGCNIPAPINLSETDNEFSHCEWKSWDELISVAIPSKLLMYHFLRIEVEPIIRYLTYKHYVNIMDN